MYFITCFLVVFLFYTLTKLRISIGLIVILFLHLLLTRIARYIIFVPSNWIL